MESRPLGRTGLTVSAIGLGCVTFGREIGRDASFAVLDHALARGITLYDTAAAYGGGASETILGEWLDRRNLRGRVLVQTKALPPATRDRLLASADASRRRLRLDCLDLFLLHRWDDATPRDETLDALDELVRSGRTRFAGCSNLEASQLARALDAQAARGLARFEVVEPIYNLVHRDIESGLLPLCAERQVGVVTYSPLGAGFLAGKYAPGAAVPAGTRFDIIPGHQALYFSDRGFKVLDRLRRASAETGRSMVELALAWVLRRPGVTSVLVGARNPAQVDQAFAAQALAANGLPPDNL